MAYLKINQDKIPDKAEFIKVCPFGAMELKNGEISINAACKMCRLCIKKSGNNAIEYIEEKKEAIDKSLWRDICVYVDHDNGEIHPVTYELIGKARELADKTGQKTCCLFMGSNIKSKAQKLLYYGVDEVYIYENQLLEGFSIEAYTAVFEDFINNKKPCALLVGATPVGRQLAPRVAARFKTGLTADCTILDMEQNTDLIQIRPAFGGNIMAQICTPNTRPQLATVRYKVMDAPKKEETKSGKIIDCKIDKSKLCSNITVINVIKKPKTESIENAEIIVVAGRGVKSKDDLKMLRELAELLGGTLASTRPLVENGWCEAKNQVGLSGRTVRPKLIITCGVSGAVQFAAGMNNSENIFAVNSDKNAPIFKYANYGVVGDIYEIIPKLISRIKAERGCK